MRGTERVDAKNTVLDHPRRRRGRFFNAEEHGRRFKRDRCHRRRRYSAKTCLAVRRDNMDRGCNTTHRLAEMQGIRVKAESGGDIGAAMGRFDHFRAEAPAWPVPAGQPSRATVSDSKSTVIIKDPQALRMRERRRICNRRLASPGERTRCPPSRQQRGRFSRPATGSRKQTPMKRRAREVLRLRRIRIML